jgi:hypothetical protein
MSPLGPLGRYYQPWKKKHASEIFLLAKITKFYIFADRLLLLLLLLLLLSRVASYIQFVTTNCLNTELV